MKLSQKYLCTGCSNDKLMIYCGETLTLDDWFRCIYGPDAEYNIDFYRYVENSEIIKSLHENEKIRLVGAK